MQSESINEREIAIRSVALSLFLCAKWSCLESRYFDIIASYRIIHDRVVTDMRMEKIDMARILNFFLFTICGEMSGWQRFSNQEWYHRICGYLISNIFDPFYSKINCFKTQWYEVDCIVNLLLTWVGTIRHSIYSERRVAPSFFALWVLSSFERAQWGAGRAIRRKTTRDIIALLFPSYGD